MKRKSEMRNGDLSRGSDDSPPSGDRQEVAVVTPSGEDPLSGGLTATGNAENWDFGAKTFLRVTQRRDVCACARLLRSGDV